MSALLLAAIVLFLASSASAVLLFRVVSAGRLRERVGDVRTHDAERVSPVPVQLLNIRSAGQRSARAVQFMRMLQCNPEIAHQNIIAWKLVIGIACAVALLGFLYGREFVGWPLAAVLTP